LTALSDSSSDEEDAIVNSVRPSAPKSQPPQTDLPDKASSEESESESESFGHNQYATMLSASVSWLDDELTETTESELQTCTCMSSYSLNLLFLTWPGIQSERQELPSHPIHTQGPLIELADRLREYVAAVT
jgi:hypothetical protein